MTAPGCQVLLLGSAPYLPHWWRQHGRAYLDAGYMVACINNSWKALGERLPDLWIRPDDYFATSPPAMHPAPELIAVMQVITPIEYDRPGPVRVAKVDGGTMVLNSIQFILNRFLSSDSDERCELHIAGCELDYPAGASHFYAGGVADPLRRGVGWIRAELERIAELSAAWPQISIWNAGCSGNSVLPFARRVVAEGSTSSP